MVNLVVKKIFQCSYTRTTKKSITCSLVARCKVFFERNELTAVKVEASSLKMRPSRSLRDHFFTKFDISLNYRRFFSLPLDFNSALRRRYNVQSAEFVLQLSVPLHATEIDRNDGDRFLTRAPETDTGPNLGIPLRWPRAKWVVCMIMPPLSCVRRDRGETARFRRTPESSART